MNSDRLIALLHRASAIEFGEFTLRGGEKTNFFIDAEKLVDHPEIFQTLVSEFTRKLKNVRIDIIVGVANGGIPFAQATAHTLSSTRGCEVPWIEAAKLPDGTFYIPRSSMNINLGYAFVLDDVGTTGSGVRATLDALFARQGSPTGVGYFIKRGNITSANVNGVKKLITLNEEPLENFLSE